MSNPLSVTQALSLAKDSLNKISATIVGEISELSDKIGYKAIYYTITDENSALSCLMWRNAFSASGIELKQGMLVEVTGYFTLYAAKGRMNFDVKALKIAGEGDLRLKVARLAKKLEAQGMMSVERKRELPAFPSSIAVVTSPRGKAIHDVLRTLKRRYPLCEVLVCGVPVEGNNAAESIIEGLRAAQESRAELILLVRGGGSYEDMMPFNDELLACAIASCPIPIVTGIGHEPDNSIADMVADLRASTPTAAAERVVPNISDLSLAFCRMGGVLSRLLYNKVDKANEKLKQLSKRALFTDSNNLLSQYEILLEGANYRIHQTQTQNFNSLQESIRYSRSVFTGLGIRCFLPFANALRIHAAQLESLSPLKTLLRGYSIMLDNNNHVIDSVDKVEFEQEINVRLSDGILGATITTKQKADIKKSK